MVPAQYCPMFNTMSHAAGACKFALHALQSASKAEKLAKEEERRQADLRSYKGIMTVSYTLHHYLCYMHTES